MKFDHSWIGKYTIAPGGSYGCPHTSNMSFHKVVLEPPSWFTLLGRKKTCVKQPNLPNFTQHKKQSKSTQLKIRTKKTTWSKFVILDLLYITSYIKVDLPHTNTPGPFWRDFLGHNGLRNLRLVPRSNAKRQCPATRQQSTKRDSLKSHLLSLGSMASGHIYMGVS